MRALRFSFRALLFLILSPPPLCALTSSTSLFTASFYHRSSELASASASASRMSSLCSGRSAQHSGGRHCLKRRTRNSHTPPAVLSLFLGENMKSGVCGSCLLVVGFMFSPLFCKALHLTCCSTDRSLTAYP